MFYRLLVSFDVTNLARYLYGVEIQFRGAYLDLIVAESLLDPAREVFGGL